MNIQNKIKIAIVVSHPIQHFVHLYKALSKLKHIQLRVFFASSIGHRIFFDKNMNTELKWNIDLLSGYDYEFLTEADFINSTDFWALNNPSIVSALKKYSPDVVQLHGYARLTMLRALFWCRLRRIPVLLTTDSSLLFVGKLAPWKRPQDLLNTLSLAQAELGKTLKLVAFFAGDGVMRKSLEAEALLRNSRAIFAGFINVDELPSIYAMSDILVFPSEIEPYGLSAREAICVGLPLIGSDQIGCVWPLDASRPDYNALIYPNCNVTALVNAIVSLANNHQKLVEMSQASLLVAHEMREEISVAGFLYAVQNAFNAKNNVSCAKISLS